MVDGLGQTSFLSRLLCFAIGDVDWPPVEFRLKVPWRLPLSQASAKSRQVNLDLLIRVETAKTMLDAEIVFKMKLLLVLVMDVQFWGVYIALAL
jgi:hypothetical protein